MADPVYTRARWLYFQTMLDGVPWWLAVEAVHSVAIEHPEWDLSETRTWAEWEASSLNEQEDQ